MEMHSIKVSMPGVSKCRGRSIYALDTGDVQY